MKNFGIIDINISWIKSWLEADEDKTFLAEILFLQYREKSKNK